MKTMNELAKRAYALTQEMPLLALWAVVLAGMAAFAAVVLLHLRNNAF